jgi:hypothetical protein
VCGTFSLLFLLPKSTTPQGVVLHTGNIKPLKDENEKQTKRTTAQGVVLHTSKQVSYCVTSKVSHSQVKVWIELSKCIVELVGEGLGL